MKFMEPTGLAFHFFTLYVHEEEVLKTGTPSPTPPRRPPPTHPSKKPEELRSLHADPVSLCGEDGGQE